MAITRDSCVDVEDLKSNQEEAGTRMLLHAKYAAGQCQEATIVIQSPDTDVLVLSAAHFEDITSKELWFHTGVKDRLHFVPVHDVCQNLSNRVLKVLPAFHALTSCDTTRALSGIGKKKPWNVLIQSTVHQESLTILGQQPEVDEETAKKCEAFICDLYPSYKKSPKTADELRYIIFCQKKPNSEALPTTSDSVRQHINHANYQTHIWRKSLDALLDLPSPEGRGWQKEDDELKAKLMSKDPAPTSLLELTMCTRKKKECSGQRLYKRNLSLYLYMFIAVTLTSSLPTACSRLTL